MTRNWPVHHTLLQVTRASYLQHQIIFVKQGNMDQVFTRNDLINIFQKMSRSSFVEHDLYLQSVAKEGLFSVKHT